jgi:hypothetical protein
MVPIDKVMCGIKAHYRQQDNVQTQKPAQQKTACAEMTQK